ncbi:serine-rich adhesin for platelets-like [Biomphalaria glabrata]|uniref:Serine-rich adhesin for platelets-like n=1 Tax=Biomphalaria glabrata TaxID=6526 RepID=A0A9W3A998_BIOGL|nr:serine-rich adhesin for platelets-like [Biomphalaria glabrata]
MEQIPNKDTPTTEEDKKEESVKPTSYKETLLNACDEAAEIAKTTAHHLYTSAKSAVENVAEKVQSYTNTLSKTSTGIHKVNSTSVDPEIPFSYPDICINPFSNDIAYPILPLCVATPGGFPAENQRLEQRIPVNPNSTTYPGSFPWPLDCLSSYPYPLPSALLYSQLFYPPLLHEAVNSPYLQLPACPEKLVKKRKHSKKKKRKKRVRHVHLEDNEPYSWSHPAVRKAKWWSVWNHMDDRQDSIQAHPVKSLMPTFYQYPQQDTASVYQVAGSYGLSPGPSEKKHVAHRRQLNTRKRLGRPRSTLSNDWDLEEPCTGHRSEVEETGIDGPYMRRCSVTRSTSVSDTNKSLGQEEYEPKRTPEPRVRCHDDEVTEVNATFVRSLQVKVKSRKKNCLKIKRFNVDVQSAQLLSSLLCCDKSPSPQKAERSSLKEFLTETQVCEPRKHNKCSRNPCKSEDCFLVTSSCCHANQGRHLKQLMSHFYEDLVNLPDRTCPTGVNLPDMTCPTGVNSNKSNTVLTGPYNEPLAQSCTPEQIVACQTKNPCPRNNEAKNCKKTRSPCKPEKCDKLEKDFDELRFPCPDVDCCMGGVLRLKKQSKLKSKSHSFHTSNNDESEKSNEQMSEDLTESSNNENNIYTADMAMIKKKTRKKNRSGNKMELSYTGPNGSAPGLSLCQKFLISSTAACNVTVSQNISTNPNAPCPSPSLQEATSAPVVYGIYDSQKQLKGHHLVYNIHGGVSGDNKNMRKREKISYVCSDRKVKSRPIRSKLIGRQCSRLHCSILSPCNGSPLKTSLDDCDLRQCTRPENDQEISPDSNVSVSSSEHCYTCSERNSRCFQSPERSKPMFEFGLSPCQELIHWDCGKKRTKVGGKCLHENKKVCYVSKCGKKTHHRCPHKYNCCLKAKCLGPNYECRPLLTCLEQRIECGQIPECLQKTYDCCLMPPCSDQTYDCCLMPPCSDQTYDCCLMPPCSDQTYDCCLIPPCSDQTYDCCPVPECPMPKCSDQTYDCRAVPKCPVPKCSDQTYDCRPMPKCSDQTHDCRPLPKCSDQTYDCRPMLKCSDQTYDCRPLPKCSDQKYDCRPLPKCSDQTYDCRPMPKCSDQTYDCRPLPKCSDQTYDCRPLPKCSDQTYDCRPLPKCSDQTYDCRPMPKCSNQTYDCRPLPKCSDQTYDCRPLPKCLDQTYDCRPMPKCSDQTYDCSPMPKCSDQTYDCRPLPKCSDQTYDCRPMPKCSDQTYDCSPMPKCSDQTYDCRPMPKCSDQTYDCRPLPKFSDQTHAALVPKCLQKAYDIEEKPKCCKPTCQSCPISNYSEQNVCGTKLSKQNNVCNKYPTFSEKYNKCPRIPKYSEKNDVCKQNKINYVQNNECSQTLKYSELNDCCQISKCYEENKDCCPTPKLVGENNLCHQTSMYFEHPNDCQQVPMYSEQSKNCYQRSKNSERNNHRECPVYKTTCQVDKELEDCHVSSPSNQYCHVYSPSNQYCPSHIKENMTEMNARKTSGTKESTRTCTANSTQTFPRNKCHRKLKESKPKACHRDEGVHVKSNCFVKSNMCKTDSSGYLKSQSEDENVVCQKKAKENLGTQKTEPRAEDFIEPCNLTKKSSTAKPKSYQQKTCKESSNIECETRNDHTKSIPKVIPCKSGKISPSQEKDVCQMCPSTGHMSPCVWDDISPCDGNDESVVIRKQDKDAKPESRDQVRSRETTKSVKSKRRKKSLPQCKQMKPEPRKSEDKEEMSETSSSSRHNSSRDTQSSSTSQSDHYKSSTTSDESKNDKKSTFNDESNTDKKSNSTRKTQADKKPLSLCQRKEKKSKLTDESQQIKKATSKSKKDKKSTSADDVFKDKSTSISRNKDKNLTSVIPKNKDKNSDGQSKDKNSDGQSKDKKSTKKEGTKRDKKSASVSQSNTDNKTRATDNKTRATDNKTRATDNKTRATDNIKKDGQSDSLSQDKKSLSKDDSNKTKKSSSSQSDEAVKSVSKSQSDEAVKSVSKSQTEDTVSSSSDDSELAIKPYLSSQSDNTMTSSSSSQSDNAVKSTSSHESTKQVLENEDSQETDSACAWRCNSLKRNNTSNSFPNASFSQFSCQTNNSSEVAGNTDVLVNSQKVGSDCRKSRYHKVTKKKSSYFRTMPSDQKFRCNSSSQKHKKLKFMYRHPNRVKSKWPDCRSLNPRRNTAMLYLAETKSTPQTDCYQIKETPSFEKLNKPSREDYEQSKRTSKCEAQAKPCNERQETSSTKSKCLRLKQPVQSTKHDSVRGMKQDSDCSNISCNSMQCSFSYQTLLNYWQTMCSQQEQTISDIKHSQENEKISQHVGSKKSNKTETRKQSNKKPSSLKSTSYYIIDSSSKNIDSCSQNLSPNNSQSYSSSLETPTILYSTSDAYNCPACSHLTNQSFPNNIYVWDKSKLSSPTHQDCLSRNEGWNQTLKLDSDERAIPRDNLGPEHFETKIQTSQLKSSKTNIPNLERVRNVVLADSHSSNIQQSLGHSPIQKKCTSSSPGCDLPSCSTELDQTHTFSKRQSRHQRNVKAPCYKCSNGKELKMLSSHSCAQCRKQTSPCHSCARQTKQLSPCRSCVYVNQASSCQSSVSQVKYASPCRSCVNGKQTCQLSPCRSCGNDKQASQLPPCRRCVYDKQTSQLSPCRSCGNNKQTSHLSQCRSCVEGKKNSQLSPCRSCGNNKQTNQLSACRSCVNARKCAKIQSEKCICPSYECQADSPMTSPVDIHGDQNHVISMPPCRDCRHSTRKRKNNKKPTIKTCKRKTNDLDNSFPCMCCTLPLEERFHTKPSSQCRSHCKPSKSAVKENKTTLSMVLSPKTLSEHKLSSHPSSPTEQTRSSFCIEPTNLVTLEQTWKCQQRKFSSQISMSNERLNTRHLNEPRTTIDSLSYAKDITGEFAKYVSRTADETTKSGITDEPNVCLPPLEDNKMVGPELLAVSQSSIHKTTQEISKGQGDLLLQDKSSYLQNWFNILNLPAQNRQCVSLYSSSSCLQATHVTSPSTLSLCSHSARLSSSTLSTNCPICPKTCAGETTRDGATDSCKHEHTHETLYWDNPRDLDESKTKLMESLSVSKSVSDEIEVISLGEEWNQHCGSNSAKSEECQSQNCSYPPISPLQEAVPVLESSHRSLDVKIQTRSHSSFVSSTERPSYRARSPDRTHKLHKTNLLSCTRKHTHSFATLPQPPSPSMNQSLSAVSHRFGDKTDVDKTGVDKTGVDKRQSFLCQPSPNQRKRLSSSFLISIKRPEVSSVAPSKCNMPQFLSQSRRSRNSCQRRKHCSSPMVQTSANVTVTNQSKALKSSLTRSVFNIQSPSLLEKKYSTLNGRSHFSRDNTSRSNLEPFGQSTNLGISRISAELKAKLLSPCEHSKMSINSNHSKENDMKYLETCSEEEFWRYLYRVKKRIPTEHWTDTDLYLKKHRTNFHEKIKTEGVRCSLSHWICHLAKPREQDTFLVHNVDINQEKVSTDCIEQTTESASLHHTQYTQCQECSFHRQLPRCQRDDICPSTETSHETKIRTQCPSTETGRESKSRTQCPSTETGRESKSRTQCPAPRKETNYCQCCLAHKRSPPTRISIHINTDTKRPCQLTRDASITFHERNKIQKTSQKSRTNSNLNFVGFSRKSSAGVTDFPDTSAEMKANLLFLSKLFKHHVSECSGHQKVRKNKIHQNMFQAKHKKTSFLNVQTNRPSDSGSEISFSSNDFQSHTNRAGQQRDHLCIHQKPKSNSKIRGQKKNKNIDSEHDRDIFESKRNIVPHTNITGTSRDPMNTLSRKHCGIAGQSVTRSEFVDCLDEALRNVKKQCVRPTLWDTRFSEPLDASTWRHREAEITDLFGEMFTSHEPKVADESTSHYPDTTKHSVCKQASTHDHHCLSPSSTDHHYLSPSSTDHHYLSPSSTDHHYLSPSCTDHHYLSPSATDHHYLSPSSTDHHYLSPSATDHHYLSPSATDHHYLSPSSTDHHYLSPSATDHHYLSPSSTETSLSLSFCSNAQSANAIRSLCARTSSAFKYPKDNRIIKSHAPLDPTKYRSTLKNCELIDSELNNLKMKSTLKQKLIARACQENFKSNLKNKNNFSCLEADVNVHFNRRKSCTPLISKRPRSSRLQFLLTSPPATTPAPNSLPTNPSSSVIFTDLISTKVKNVPVAIYRDTYGTFERRR